MQGVAVLQHVLALSPSRSFASQSEVLREKVLVRRVPDSAIAM